MPEPLAGQHAIVTGGGRGIGAAISSALAEAGARVTIMGRDRAVLESHAKMLGAGAAAIVCDVSDERSVEKALERGGSASILVNNDGQGKREKLARTMRELWGRSLGVNIAAYFLCRKRGVPRGVVATRGRGGTL